MQEKIISGAFRLFMKYGIKSVSMDDLASHLGVSKKTIYNFIENKKDLINAVITEHLEEDQKKIRQIIDNSENALDEMIQMSRHILNFLRKMKPTVLYDLKKYYPECWKLIDDHHFRDTYEIISNNIRRGIREGLYRDDVRPEIIARFYVKVTECAVDELIFPPERFKQQDLFVSHVNYHIRGILNDKGRKIFKEISIN